MVYLIDQRSTRQVFHEFRVSLNLLWSRSPSKRVVVVRGGTGSGRTAVLQGLYELAAASQGRATYWPPQLVGDQTDPSAARDVLYPDAFDVAAGTRLPFLWWALSGLDEEALGRADHQLSVHASPFGAALADLDEQARRRVAVAAETVFLLGGLIPVVGPLVQTLDNLVTGAGIAREVPRLAVPRRSQVEAALTVEESRRFTMRPDFVAQAESDARLLGELSRWVPLLVVADDADGLDETAISLLNTLARSARGSVLVVLTVNTDHHPTRPDDPLKDIEEVYNPELQRFLAGLNAPGMLRVVDLDPWSPEELTDLARVTVTAMDGEPTGSWSADALAEVVLAAGAAPGRLVTLLGHRSIRAAIRGEGALPGDLVGLQTGGGVRADRWAALAPAQRWALANLALHGPRTLEALTNDTDVQAALTTRWVRAIPGVGPQGRVVEFVSATCYAAARASLISELGPEQPTSARRRLADRLAELRPQWPDLPFYVLDSLLTELLRAPDFRDQAPPAMIAAHLRLRRATGQEAATAAVLDAILRRSQVPVGELLVATAEGLADAGYTYRAIDAFSEALDRFTSEYGPGSPPTLPTLHNLASAWVAHAQAAPPDQRKSSYDTAAELYERLVAGWARHQAPGQIDKRLPDARAELAVLYAENLHRFRDAIDHGIRCVNEREACADYGLLHPDTLKSRNDLAYFYSSAGDLGRAIPLLEQTLADSERVLGGDHQNTLRSRNNLAHAFRSAGDLGRAIPLLEQTLADSERVLGGDHPDTLMSRSNLANSYKSAGDLGRAIPLFEQTLADSERVLGGDHPHTLTSRNNLAHAFHSAGDLGRAIPLFEQTLADSERVLGDDRPNTLTSRSNLANSYQSAGDLGRAIPLFEQTLADSERVLGSDHPHTLTSRNNLAHAFHSAGDLGRAIPLYEQTLADSERVLGGDHPNTLTSRSNLAYAFHSAGDLGRAIPLLEQTLADSERVLGGDHPNTLTSRSNLAYAFHSAGDLGRAIPLSEQTLADSERVLGGDHPHTLTSRSNLAGVYESAGDVGRAIPLFEQTLADRERVLGGDHPHTLTSRNNLAHAFRSAGDLGRAIPLFEQTLADSERVLGDDHPDTLASRNNLQRLEQEHPIE